LEGGTTRSGGPFSSLLAELGRSCATHGIPRTFDGPITLGNHGAHNRTLYTGGTVSRLVSRQPSADVQHVWPRFSPPFPPYLRRAIEVCHAALQAGRVVELDQWTGGSTRRDVDLTQARARLPIPKNDSTSSPMARRRQPRYLSGDAR